MNLKSGNSTAEAQKGSPPLSASTVDSVRLPDRVAARPEEVPLEMPVMPAITSPWLTAVEREALVTGHVLPTSLRSLLQDRRFVKVVKGPARGTMQYRDYFMIDGEMLARVLLEEETRP